MSEQQDAVFAGSLSKVWKSFRRRIQALDSLTLRIPQGAAFALLGPNGAGKTTFVKILIGAVRPTSGVATVFGHPAGSLGARKRIGYVPETASAPLHLTGAQLIDFQSALHGVAQARRRHRAAELLAQVGMTRWADVPLRKYSHGMRQRVCIAAALAHEPEMLILDEPTHGLDPASRRDVLDLLRNLNRQRGVTLLVNSHVLHEVEELCTEVAILNEGRLVRSGAVAALTGGGGYTITLTGVSLELEHLLASKGVTAARQTGDLLRVYVPSRTQLDATLDLARASSACIESLERSTSSLEEVYLTEVTA